MIERSHGKARPMLPRAKDLPSVIKADDKPREGRSSGGHFAAGNRIGIGARWKHSVKKLLGRRAGDGETALVASDAFRVFLATLRTLPTDAAPVRSLVALHARHVALAAFYGAQAETVGLATPEGIKLDEVAARHSQRAERVMVTALDVAVRLSAKKKPEVTAAALEEAFGGES